MTITAFVVDDSAIVRKHLADTLTAGGILVLGTAVDPIFAWPKLAVRWPDVIVLDVEMPRMDGITFLKRLMAERPTPVVMCSTLTERGCATTLAALAAGAVGFVTKPKMGLKDFLDGDSNGLVQAVRAASQARVRGPDTAGAAPAMAGRAVVPPTGSQPAALADRHSANVVAIGISTGGVQAIETVLRQLDLQAPGIVVVQHMPEHFTASLAQRLDANCVVEVREASDGDAVLRGRVLIAPGGRHMTLERSGKGFRVAVRDGPLINHHRPSVDVLFRSVATAAGARAAGIVMTGMGHDGARGLRDMHQAGARTAAQDEASCVVFGMPAEAIRLGAADDVVTLGDVAVWIGQAFGAAHEP